MAHKLLLLVHMVGFAAYIGAGFAQQQFMARSAEGGLASVLRDHYERLAATIATKIEVPAIGVQVVTGVTFILLSPAWLHLGWLHAKLTCVALLMGLSHAEMFNARKIVAARAAQGDGAADAIAARKKRHALMGTVGSVLVVAVLVLVAYGTG